MWRVAKTLVPLGRYQGAAVLRLHPGEGACLDSSIRDVLLSDEQFSVVCPLFIEGKAFYDDGTPTAAQRITGEEIIEIMEVRPVYLVHRADEVYDLPCSWRTVLAFDEAFYEMHTKAGNELIAEPHADHLMEETWRDTSFDYYYVMPFDDETEAEAKEFILGQETPRWALTKMCFEGVTATELKRIMSDG